MTTETQPASANADQSQGPRIRACDNPAVSFCCQAWQRAYENARAAGKDHFDGKMAGYNAYREALPPLAGARNIRDFIACVAHGMATDILLIETGARLLYAAQVANGARKAKSAKSRPESAQNKTLVEHLSPGCEAFPASESNK